MSARAKNECKSCGGFGYFFTGVEASESQKERIDCPDCDGWGFVSRKTEGNHAE